MADLYQEFPKFKAGIDLYKQKGYSEDVLREAAARWHLEDLQAEGKLSDQQKESLEMAKANKSSVYDLLQGIKQGNHDGSVMGRMQAKRDPSMEVDPSYWQTFKGGVSRSVDQVQAMGYGVMAMAGDAIGSEEISNAGIQGYQRNMEEASQAGGKQVTLTQLWESDEKLNDFFHFAAGSIGENIPTMATIMAGGGLGGVLAKKVATKVITKKMAGEIAKKAETTILKSALEKVAAAGAKKIATAGAIGEGIGAGAAGIGMEAGSIYGDIYDKTGEKHAGVALAYGTAAGLLEALPVVAIMKKVNKDVAGKFTEKLVDWMGSGMFHERFLKGGLTEATTEGLQTVIEKLAVKHVDENADEFGPEGIKEIIDAMGSGGFGGGFFSAVTGKNKPKIDDKMTDYETQDGQRIEGGFQNEDMGFRWKDTQEMLDTATPEELRDVLSGKFGEITDEGRVKVSEALKANKDTERQQKKAAVDMELYRSWQDHNQSRDVDFSQNVGPADQTVSDYEKFRQSQDPSYQEPTQDAQLTPEQEKARQKALERSQRNQPKKAQPSNEATSDLFKSDPIDQYSRPSEKDVTRYADDLKGKIQSLEGAKEVEKAAREKGWNPKKSEMDAREFLVYRFKNSYEEANFNNGDPSVTIENQEELPVTLPKNEVTSVTKVTTNKKGDTSGPYEQWHSADLGQERAKRGIPMQKGTPAEQRQKIITLLNAIKNSKQTVAGKTENMSTKDVSPTSNSDEISQPAPAEEPLSTEGKKAGSDEIKKEVDPWTVEDYGVNLEHHNVTNVGSNYRVHVGQERGGKWSASILKTDVDGDMIKATDFNSRKDAINYILSQKILFGDKAIPETNSEEKDVVDDKDDSTLRKALAGIKEAGYIESKSRLDDNDNIVKEDQTHISKDKLIKVLDKFGLTISGVMARPHESIFSLSRYSHPSTMEATYVVLPKPSISELIESNSEPNPNVAKVNDIPTASNDEYHISAAESAFAHSSRYGAKASQAEYVKNINSTYEGLNKNLNPDQQKYLDKEMVAFKREYLDKEKSMVFPSRSSTYSATIAGGSNFNRKQSEKRFSAADKAADNFFKWVKDRISSIEKGIASRKNEDQRKTEQEKAIKKERSKERIAFTHVVADMNDPGSEKSLFRNRLNREWEALKAYPENAKETVNLVNKALAKEGTTLEAVIGSRSKIWPEIKAFMDAESTEQADQDYAAMNTKELKALATQRKVKSRSGLIWRNRGEVIAALEDDDKKTNVDKYTTDPLLSRTESEELGFKATSTDGMSGKEMYKTVVKDYYKGVFTKFPEMRVGLSGTETAQAINQAKAEAQAEIDAAKKQPEVVQNAESEPTITIVGCVAGKLGESAQAKDLYTSQLFKARRAYVEASGSDWAILSAEHGLIDTDKTVAPYDTTMGSLAAYEKKALIRDLRKSLIERIGNKLEKGAAIRVLAGKEYVDAIAEALAGYSETVIIENPMLGLGIGEQLKYLKDNTESKPNDGPVFHEDYTGPRYTYGFTIRPLSINTHPKEGQILGSYDENDKRTRHGSIQYTRPLTEKEMSHYDLKDLDKVEPTQEEKDKAYTERYERIKAEREAKKGGINNNENQRRAKAGGEYGPNGEWYPGGAFIATTEKPKGGSKSGGGSGKQEIRPYTYALPPKENLTAIKSQIVEAEVLSRGKDLKFGNPNEKYLRKLYSEGMDGQEAPNYTDDQIQEVIERQKTLIKAFNDGASWVDKEDGSFYLEDGSKYKASDKAERESESKKIQNAPQSRDWGMIGQMSTSKPLSTEEDKKLMQEHGWKGLEEKGYTGVLERLTNTGYGKIEPDLTAKQEQFVEATGAEVEDKPKTETKAQEKRRLLGSFSRLDGFIGEELVTLAETKAERNAAVQLAGQLLYFADVTPEFAKYPIVTVRSTWLEFSDGFKFKLSMPQENMARFGWSHDQIIAVDLYGLSRQVSYTVRKDLLPTVIFREGGKEAKAGKYAEVLDRIEEANGGHVTSYKGSIPSDAIVKHGVSNKTFISGIRRFVAHGRPFLATDILVFEGTDANGEKIEEKPAPQGKDEKSDIFMRTGDPLKEESQLIAKIKDGKKDVEKVFAVLKGDGKTALINWQIWKFLVKNFPNATFEKAHGEGYQGILLREQDGRIVAVVAPIHQKSVDEALANGETQDFFANVERSKAKKAYEKENAPKKKRNYGRSEVDTQDNEDSEMDDSAPEEDDSENIAESSDSPEESSKTDGEGSANPTIRPAIARLADAEPSLAHIDEATASIDEESTVDEFRAAFNGLRKNEEHIKSLLNKFNLADLKKKMFMYGSGYKKADYVDGLYKSMLHRFFPKSIQYDPMKESSTQYMDRIIESITQEDIDKQIAEKKKLQAERQEQMEGIKNPKTLAQFRAKARVFGRDKMTVDELRRWDEAAAYNTIKEREAEQAKKAILAQVELGDTSMEMVQTKHTVKGHDLWVVKLSDRVSRDSYSDLNIKAKRLGGYYSSFRHNGAVPGFQFKSEADAKNFMALKEGDVDNTEKVEQRKQSKLEATLERLKGMADNIESQGEEDLNADRKTNTAKRAREAASAELDAARRVNFAKTLKNIIEGIENGDVVILKGIKAATHIATLESELRHAMWSAVRKNKEPYSESREPQFEDIDALDKPRGGTVRPDIIRDAVVQVRNVDGMKMLVNKVLKWVEQSKEDTVEMPDSIEEAVNEIRSKLARSSSSNAKTAKTILDDATESNRRFEAMGIEGSPMIRAALREYYNLRSNSVKPDPLKVKEREVMRSLSKEKGFFPTPKDIAVDMVQLAEIEPGMKVLEPSGGKGNIADEIRNYAPEADLDVIEKMNSLRELLKLKGHNVVGDDFLTFGTPDETTLKNMRENVKMFNSFSEKLEGTHKVGLTRARATTQHARGQDLAQQRDMVQENLAKMVREEMKKGNIIPADIMDVVKEYPNYNEEGKYDPVTVNGIAYDRILMNPPFEDGQDMEHVMRAFEMLAPGGKLIAITSESPFFRKDSKSEAFRQFVDQYGKSEKMEAGSFLNAERSTGVNTRMVTLTKPNASEVKYSKPEGDKPVTAAHIQEIFENIRTLRQEAKSLRNVKIVVKHGEDKFNGYFDPAANEIVINADVITSMDDLRAILQHEDLVHRWMKAGDPITYNLMMGRIKAGNEAFQTQIERVAKLNATDPDVKGTYFENGKLTDLGAEEVLAYWVQENPMDGGGDAKYYWHLTKKLFHYLKKYVPFIETTEREVADIMMDGFYKYTQGKGGPKGPGPDGGRRFAKNPDWEKEVDRLIDGDLDRGESLTLGSTPHVLQMLGAKDLPLEMTQRIANKILDRHEFSKNFFKMLPDALEDPIAVFWSANEEDGRRSRIVLTEMTNLKGERVMVSVFMDSAKGRNTVNAVSSAYGRSLKDYQNWAGSGLLIYLNEKKNQRFGVIGGSQLTKMRAQNADSKDFMTESDLVKFREKGSTGDFSTNNPDIRYSKPEIGPRYNAYPAYEDLSQRGKARSAPKKVYEDAMEIIKAADMPSKRLNVKGGMFSQELSRKFHLSKIISRIFFDWASIRGILNYDDRNSLSDSSISFAYDSFKEAMADMVDNIPYTLAKDAETSTDTDVLREVRDALPLGKRGADPGKALMRARNIFRSINKNGEIGRGSMAERNFSNAAQLLKEEFNIQSDSIFEVENYGNDKAIKFSKPEMSIDQELEMSTNLRDLDSRIMAAYEADDQELVNKLETEMDGLLLDLEDFDANVDATDDTDPIETLEREVAILYNKQKDDPEALIAGLRDTYESRLNRLIDEVSDDELLEDAKTIAEGFKKLNRSKTNPMYRYSKAIHEEVSDFVKSQLPNKDWPNWLRKWLPSQAKQQAGDMNKAIRHLTTLSFKANKYGGALKQMMNAAMDRNNNKIDIASSLQSFVEPYAALSMEKRKAIDDLLILGDKENIDFSRDWYAEHSEVKKLSPEQKAAFNGIRKMFNAVKEKLIMDVEAENAKMESFMPEAARFNYNKLHREMLKLGELKAQMDEETGHLAWSFKGSDSYRSTETKIKNLRKDIAASIVKIEEMKMEAEKIENKEESFEGIKKEIAKNIDYINNLRSQQSYFPRMRDNGQHIIYWNEEKGAFMREVFRDDRSDEGDVAYKKRIAELEAKGIVPDESLGMAFKALAAKRFKGELNEEEYQFQKRELRKQGYKVDRVMDKPEEMFRSKASDSIMKVMDQAMREAGMEGKGLEVANDAIRTMFYTRGWRKHMLSRQGELYEGYKKENLHEVMNSFIHGFAGLTSKAEAAKSYYQILNTVDVNKQPEIYSNLVDIMRDELRNSDSTDKISNTLNGIVYHTYMGFRASTALINSTQNFLVGIPALGNHLRKAQLDSHKKKGNAAGFELNAAKEFAVAMKNAGAYMIAKGKAKKGEVVKVSGLKDHEVKFLDMEFERITKSDLTREMTDQLSAAKGKVGKTMAKLSEWSGWMFGKTEQLNRLSALLVYQRNFGENRTLDAELEALRRPAELFVQDVHFAYEKWNQLDMFKSPTMRVMKPFLFALASYNQNLYQSLWNMDGRSKIAFAVALTLMAGIPLEDLWEDELMDWFDTHSHKALGDGTMGKLARMGVPGALGVNMSGSLSLNAPPMLAAAFEMAGFEDLNKGPLQQIVYNLGMMVSEDPTKFETLKKYFPMLAVKSALNAYGEYEDGLTTRSGKPILVDGQPMKRGELSAIGKGIGLNTSDIADFKSRGWRDRQLSEKWSEKKGALVNRLVKAKLTDRLKMQKEVTAFNKEVMRMRDEFGKSFHVAPITRKSIAAAQREYKTYSYPKG